MIGQTFNHYEITEKLGEGGMGAVYRATDTRLGREVALKILPEKFVRDRQRMGRFQREAEVLASLNHPHINIVHALEESDGVRALVLELVEGPTLAERIAEGPIPVEETLRMALEIAQALEAAHENGVIHRDLKPANVKITPEGGVKVLDFGLAKALETEVSERELANSPTLTMEATQAGMVLATAAYMSPEQARGRPVDKRTDIWSFGLVLFEILTGQGMYAGKSFTETIAAVIHQEPSLDELPTETPRKIQELLERCLRKDPSMRLRDMGDARIAIQECLTGPIRAVEEALLPAPMGHSWQRLVPWAAVPLLALLAWSLRPDPPIERPVTRFEIPAGEGRVLWHYNRQGIDLSPDGTRLAFVSSSSEPNKGVQIYIQSLEQWNVDELADGIQPVFSPDGKWLLVRVSSDKTLKKYPVGRGPPTTVCDCQESYGASWGSDNFIVFACEELGGLWRVSGSGGDPERITEPDRAAGEVSHRLPHVLPGGREVLFTVVLHSGHPDWSTAQIALHSLETGKTQVLIENGSDGRYVPTGHLLFARKATLMAARFDLESLRLTGPFIPVLEGVSQAIDMGVFRMETGAAQFTFSASGPLAYISGSIFPEIEREVLWVDRRGTEKPTGVPPKKYSKVRLSPDNASLAMDPRGDIWTYDLVRGTSSPQTTEGLNRYPVWASEGRNLAFGSNRVGLDSMYQKSVDGLSEAEQLLPDQPSQYPGSWSGDGTKLAFVQATEVTNWDIGILHMGPPRSVELFLVHPQFREFHPAFSPDGHWLAYTSNESGENQVYVRPYPGPGIRQMISINGGLSPTWARGGRELFYREPSENGRTKWMMAVEVTISGNQLFPGTPMRLFEENYNYSRPISSVPTFGLLISVKY